MMKQIKCKIENCEIKVFAKGYCAKHYFRNRRHGDANARKKGRKPDVKKSIVLSAANFDVSERTKQKFWNFIKICSKINLDAQKIISDNTRPNGSLSFSRLESIAKSAAAAQISEGKNIFNY
jgi:hypothetical protein